MAKTYEIRLKNNLTLEEHIFSHLEQKNAENSLFYSFNLDLSNLIDGEYDLQLFEENGDELVYVSSEILRLGDYINPSTTYNKKQNYKVYEN